MDHQAFAELLGNYGEFIGSIGVVVSLFYLGVQIRQNSISTKAQAVQSTSDRMIDISLTMAADETWPDLFNRAGDDFDSLTPGERGRAGWMWFAILRGQERSTTTTLKETPVRKHGNRTQRQLDRMPKCLVFGVGEECFWHLYVCTRLRRVRLPCS